MSSYMLSGSEWSMCNDWVAVGRGMESYMVYALENRSIRCRLVVQEL